MVTVIAVLVVLFVVILVILPTANVLAHQASAKAENDSDCYEGPRKLRHWISFLSR